VALDHYLQVTEEHYAQALAYPLVGAEKSDAKSGAAGSGREQQ
jgi:hypothetical protein